MCVWGGAVGGRGVGYGGGGGGGGEIRKNKKSAQF